MSTNQLFLFADFLPTVAADVPRRERRPRPRVQKSRLFSLRKDHAERPDDPRFRWRDGEALDQYRRRSAGRRERRDEFDRLPKDVRQVKGGAYQARPWIGPGPNANVNLGLFRPGVYSNDRDAAIAAAGRAALEFKKAMAWRDADIWAVIQKLQGTIRFGLPVVPRHVLPPLVRRAGEVFGVRGDPRTFATVADAWAVAKGLFLAKAQEVRASAAA